MFLAAKHFGSAESIRIRPEYSLTQENMHARVLACCWGDLHHGRASIMGNADAKASSRPRAQVPCKRG